MPSDSRGTRQQQQAIDTAEALCRVDIRKFVASILQGFPLDAHTQEVWAQLSWLHDQRDPDLFRDHRTLELVIAIYAVIADMEDGILSSEETTHWFNDVLIANMEALQKQLRDEISLWRSEVAKSGTQ